MSTDNSIRTDKKKRRKEKKKRKKTKEKRKKKRGRKETGHLEHNTQEESSATGIPT